jgi:hypothetical protein
MDNKVLRDKIDKLKANKIIQENAKKEFADKEKKKALTDKERLDRIERILGIK